MSVKQCVPERGSACAGTATARIVAREGGWESVKCQPCVDVIRRRSGRSFDEFYHVHDLAAQQSFLRNRSLCLH